jgi:uncharacterized protein (DUF2164 family)
MRKRAPITLSDEARKQAVASLRLYAADNLDEEFGDLKAGLLLDHILEEIGPTIHNQAVVEARAYIEERAADLDATLHHAEFPLSSRRKR